MWWGRTHQWAQGWNMGQRRKRKRNWVAGCIYLLRWVPNIHLQQPKTCISYRLKYTVTFMIVLYGIWGNIPSPSTILCKHFVDYIQILHFVRSTLMVPWPLAWMNWKWDPRLRWVYLRGALPKTDWWQPPPSPTPWLSWLLVLASLLWSGLC